MVPGCITVQVWPQFRTQIHEDLPWEPYEPAFLFPCALLHWQYFLLTVVSAPFHTPFLYTQSCNRVIIVHPLVANVNITLRNALLDIKLPSITTQGRQQHQITRN